MEMADGGVKNWTMNGRDRDKAHVDNVMSHSWLAAIFCVLYAIVFVLGLLGNLTVIYVVLSRRRVRSSCRNVLIGNLAAADVVMCLLAVPFTPLSGLLRSWPFGEGLCHAVPMALGISVFVSTLTVLAIAVDRYFVIVRQFQLRMTKSVCLLVVVIIWLLSFVVSTPLAVHQKVVWVPSTDGYVCREFWPSHTSRQFFTTSSLVLQYLAPGSIITFCYIKVWLVMRAHLRSGQRTMQQVSKKQRTNQMLIAVTCIFVGCWLPLNVIHLMVDYYERMTEWSYQMLVFFVAHLIAMSSTVYNPFVYAWFNDAFRAQFQALLPCSRWRYYTATDGGTRRRGDVDHSPSRFATGGCTSTDADVNLAMSLSGDNGTHPDRQSAVSGLPIEMNEIVTTSPVD